MEGNNSREDIIRSMFSFKVQTGTYCDSDMSATILTVELLIDNKLEGHLFIDVPLDTNCHNDDIAITLNDDCIFPLMIWLDADDNDLTKILSQTSILIEVVNEWLNN